MKNILLIIAAFSLLQACANQYTTNGEYHYMESKNGPRLEVPANLSAANISDFYNLPEQKQNPKVSIKPPSS